MRVSRSHTRRTMVLAVLGVTLLVAGTGGAGVGPGTDGVAAAPGRTDDRKPPRPARANPASDGLLNAVSSQVRTRTRPAAPPTPGPGGGSAAQPTKGVRTAAATESTALDLALPDSTSAGGVSEGAGMPGSVGASTLILYDTTGEHGFLGELFALVTANLAGHFGSWRAQPVSQYQAGQSSQYSATIYIGSTYDEPLPQAFLDDVYRGAKPVIWIYNNIWALTNRFPTFGGRYGWNWSQFDLSTVNQVRYKGVTLARDGARNGAGIMDFQYVDAAKATVLASAVRPDGSTFPWAVRSGNLTYIGENPFVYSGEKDRTMIFSDLLFDALDPAAGDRRRALVRLEDIHPAYDPSTFRAAVDYLNRAGVPFSFGVSPVYRDPLGIDNNGQDTTVRMRDERARQLRDMIVYAQQRGGVMLYHGYTHQYESLRNPYNGVTGDDFEFYRAIENADHTLTFQGPVPADSPSWFLNRIDSGLAEFQAAGLSRPSIFEFPHYAGSHVDYTTLLQRHTARYERALYFRGHLSGGAIDYGRVIGQMFPYVVRDVYGSVVLPENIGNYEPEPFFQYPVWTVADMLDAADKNKVVRDGFASFYYHAFWGTAALRQTVEGLRSRGYTFVDAGRLALGDTAPPRKAVPPRNTALPTISGAVEAGQVVTASTGTWDFGPTSFSFQWQVCDDAWYGCIDVAGATATTYTVQPHDVGHMLSVRVRATNAQGSTVATAVERGPVGQAGADAAPRNTSPPAISGSTQEGSTLTVSNGEWSGAAPIGYSYQWLRCDSAGATCATVAGATAQTYVLAGADVGRTMRAWVSASNAYGSAFAETAATAVVTPRSTATPPSSTSPPTITGTAREGQALSASSGTWSGTEPITYAYQWLRCNSAGGECVDVAGATVATYTLVAADVGRTMRVRVRASNAAGSSSATSAETAVVTAAATATAPANTSLPTISGTAAAGQTLTASHGTWTGTEPITYAFQWLRCNKTGGGCTAISGATAATYTVNTSDRNSTLRVRVTAANAAGSAQATSGQTALVPR